MKNESLVIVDNVSKRFCRSLKRSLWYGMRDIGAELLASRRDHLELRKTEFWALQDVSFSIEPGECVALIGPNGAGKSTMLKLLNGLMKPDSGSIEINGRVGALIELGSGFNPILSGRENIYVNASVLGLRKKEVDERLDEIIAFAEIDEFIDAPVRTYSSGMRVRLGFSVAAHLKPELLIIDEVLAVGDVGFRMKCFKHILSLIDQGTSVILVSHNLSELSRVARRSIVFGHGRKTFDGNLGEGVIQYEELLFRQSQERDRQAGQGKARIAEVTLFDDKGQPKNVFVTGDTVRMRVQFDADSELKGARLHAALDSVSLGRLGGVSTSYTNFEFDVVPPSTTVELVLPDLPLLTGRYMMELSLYGPDITDFQDRWMPACQFDVLLPPDNIYARDVSHTFCFNHHWEMAGE